MNPKASLCWKIWLGLAFLLLLIRFSVFYGVEGEEIPFNLFTAYALISWGSMILLNFVYGTQLNRYLKNTHYEFWLDAFSFRGRNNFLFLKFIFSKEIFGDEVLGDLKREYRNYIKLMLSIFITLPLLFITIMPPVAQLIESLIKLNP